MPDETPIQAKHAWLKGPFTLKINPHENGIAVSIDPHLDRRDLAGLLVGVIDSIMIEQYIPITILLARDKGTSTQILNAAGVDSDTLARVLRGLADGIESKQST